MAKVKVDFSKVEDGGLVRVREADYVVTITGHRFRDSQAGNSMIVWTFEFCEGRAAGKSIIDRTTLTPKSLWRLKKLLEATGATIPKRAVSLDPSRYHGRRLGITVVDDEYEERNGRTRIISKVADFIDEDAVKEADQDDVDLDEIDEDEDTPKKKGKKKKKEKDEEPAKAKKKDKGKKGKKKEKDDDDDVEQLDLDEDL